jgi:RND family efflux transporter MFP subunit
LVETQFKAHRLSELKQELESLRIRRDEPASRPRRWPIVLVILLAIGAAGFYVIRARPSFGATEVETIRPTVRRGAPAEGSPLLTASGYVVARRKAVVSAKIQGRLAELKVEEGSRVKEGDVIARLESSDYDAQVVRARADIVRAEADLAEAQRQASLTQKLAKENIYSRDQADAAASRVQIAQAALGQAKANLQLQQSLLDNTLIRAPFSGVVVKKMAEVGESVAPIPPGVNISTSSGAIVALADMATLEVEADINEANVAKLGDRQPAEVVVQAFPDRKYRGTMRQIIPTADRTKATVMVKVTILDPDKDLKPEMSANVTFLEKARAKSQPATPEMTLPKDSVVIREGRPVVFTVVNGRAQQKEIVTGGERQGNWIVKQGLVGDEDIVVRPPDRLRNGDAVKTKG